MEKTKRNPEEAGRMDFWEMALFFLSLSKTKPNSPDSIKEERQNDEAVSPHSDTVTEHMLKMKDRFA